MQQTLVWKPWSNPGVETLRLGQDEAGIHASSHLMQSLGGDSMVASYLLDCDPRWRFRRLWLKADHHGPRTLSLHRDIRSHWYQNDEPRPDLDGCQHVIIPASPFTHTPVLQNAALETGENLGLRVAHIDLLTLEVKPRHQRYHCLQRRPGQHLYRCEAEGKPPVELNFDDHGLLTACAHYVRVSARTLMVDVPA